jgi:putative tricarboxylic transport membrane protein
MDLFSNLALGFSVALTLKNIFYCFVGALFGTLIGVLPGIGPLATIAMLLPITFHLEPTGALIMLAGIFYGAQYGGSTTAILVNLPGESSSVVTALDGYQMARQGRAGVALATAALASFFAGCVATVVIAVAAPALSRMALLFGPAEFTALMVMGLIAAVVLASGSIVASIGMVMVGMLLGLIGTDVTTGDQRFVFGIRQIFDGIDFVVVAMGLFGVAEIISNLADRNTRDRGSAEITRLMPNKADVIQAAPAAVRGTLLGAILGVLPGGGALVSSFASYSLEKRLADDPSRFGKGAIEGVAGPEAANNAGAQTSFIPLLTLGLPTTATAAIMLAGFQQFGLQPGPLLFTNNSQLVWGLIASLLVANFMLLVLNLPLIGLWVKLLTIPKHWLYAGILVFATLGTIGANPSVFELGILLACGLLGYGLRRFGYPIAPVVIGLILGPMAEQQLRRALAISQGDVTVLFHSWIAISLWVLAIAAVVVPMIMRARGKGEMLAQMAGDED